MWIYGFVGLTRIRSAISSKDNTAGVREREDANRTREAGNRDEVEGTVTRLLAFTGSEAVGFIDWLDEWRHLRDVCFFG